MTPDKTIETLKTETEDINALSRSLKNATRARKQYDSAETRRNTSLSEQIVLDALGGQGT